MGVWPDRPRDPASTELQFLLKILMVFRVITVTLLLGVTVVIQVKGSQVLFFAPIYVIYLLVVALYLVTIFFAAVFNQVRNLSQFAKVQLGTDLALTTLIVFLSGGHESPFPFLYLFSILWGALALASGGYWTASISSILYGTVVDLQYYRILMPPFERQLTLVASHNPWDLVGRMALHITAFFAVAFLGHQMARRYRSARQELSERTEDLKRLQNLSDVVFDSIASGILVLGSRGEIRSINSAALSILDLAGNPAQGRFAREILSEIPIDSLCRMAQTGGLNRWEGPFTDLDGQRRIIGLSISPLQEPEKGFVVIFSDLSEYRHMEDKLRVAEKLSAIGRMAASIAHEVRNPLASMSGSIQILKDSLQLESDDSRLMEIVLSEAERLNALVSDFLLYARPQTPRFETEDMRSIVRETVDFMRTGINNPDVSLTSRLPDRPLKLSVDAGQIRQILINLIRNALEAVQEKGTVTVSLAKTQEKAEARTVIAVSDDGPGIPAAILPEIFEPFKTSKQGGTGLGLAIVYQLVQIHTGSIEVRTGDGEGTTITIYLPPGRES